MGRKYLHEARVGEVDTEDEHLDRVSDTVLRFQGFLPLGKDIIARSEVHTIGMASDRRKNMLRVLSVI